MSAFSIKKQFAVGLLSFLATAAEGAELSGALGATSQGDLTARAALGYDWNKAWLSSTTGKLTGYWDLGYTYWGSGEKAGGRHSLSFAPVFSSMSLARVT